MKATRPSSNTVPIASISKPYLTSAGTGPKLRLVVLVDPQGVPRYGRAIIDDLSHADFVHVVGCARICISERRKVTQRPSGWAFRLFSKYLESRPHAAADPFEVVDWAGGFVDDRAECVQIAVEQDDLNQDELSSQLKQWAPDVIVDLSSAELRGDFCSIPRHGFWRFHFGDSSKYPEGSGLLREAIDREAVTAVEMNAIASDSAFDRILCRAEFSTDPSPSTHNRIGPVWSAQHFVIQQLWKLHIGAASAQTECAASKRARVAVRAEPPSGMSIALWFSGKNARRLRGKRNAANQPLTWRLAVRKSRVPLHVDSSRAALTDFRWLPTARGYSWADPRLFSHGASNWLFFEQWQQGLTKGEICRGLLGNDGSLSDVRPCLRQPYHLSYPQLFEEDGEIFLIPESEEAGGVDLFRARHFPDDWVLERRLIDFPCVDPTAFRWKDQWWMIVSPQNVKGVAAISWLFSASQLAGPWFVHPAGPVAASARNARGAGPIFSYESKLIRPSQDCALSYGRALLFNEILSLDGECYAENVIARVDAGWKPGLAGVHTYTRVNEWEAIDGGYTADGEDSLFSPSEKVGAKRAPVRGAHRPDGKGVGSRVMRSMFPR
jgi:hypothetical protein